jgi:hypothetical protein
LYSLLSLFFLLGLFRSVSLPPSFHVCAHSPYGPSVHHPSTLSLQHAAGCARLLAPISFPCVHPFTICILLLQHMHCRMCKASRTNLELNWTRAMLPCQTSPSTCLNAAHATRCETKMLAARRCTTTHTSHALSHRSTPGAPNPTLPLTRRTE